MADAEHQQYLNKRNAAKQALMAEGLDCRVTHCLLCAGIHSKEDARSFGVTALAEIPNLGPKSLARVKQWMGVANESNPPKNTGRFGAGNPGKPKGATNKITREFRETVRKLLEDNAENVGTWITQVAEGSGDNKADPAKALDLLAKLAEFAAPKLSRTEHTGKDGGPMQTVTRIELVDMDGDGAD